MLAACGAALGHLAGRCSSYRRELRSAHQTRAALEALARQESQVRQQLVALGQRQHEWTESTERQLGERTATLERVIEALQSVQQEQATTIQGFSHDLRNPLTVIRANAALVETLGTDPRLRSVAGNQMRAVERMEEMIQHMIRTATSHRDVSRRRPEALQVEDLEPQIRDQLRALVFGKDIQITVRCTEQAPVQVLTDRLLFTRILDNLLTNAAKYTDTGHIAVDLDGEADMLLLVISDSGRGMAGHDIERVFTARNETCEERAGDSFGLGLPGVVRLLDELNGRLEVMSRPGAGTTFWVRIPASPQQEPASPPEAPADAAVHERVVRIRPPAQTDSGRGPPVS
jgi:signal transduction histidine kinase